MFVPFWYICWLPNREIYITGTAPCSTGTGYSTSMVRLPSWYCPTFFCRSIVFHFSVTLRYIRLMFPVLLTRCFSPVSSWSTVSLSWSRWRIFDASHFDPPLLMRPMWGIPLVPYALANYYWYGNWQNYNTGNAILTHQNNTSMESIPITIPEI